MAVTDPPAPGVLAETRVEPAAPVRASVKHVTKVLDAFCFTILACSFVAELVTTLAVVIARQFGGVLAWQSEVEQLGLAALTFIGGAYAFSQGYHVTIRFLAAKMHGALRDRVQELLNAVVLATGISAALFSISLLTEGWTQYSAVLRIPETAFVLPYTLGMLILAAYGALRLVDTGTWKTALVVLLCLLGVGVIYLLRTVLGLAPADVTFGIAVILFAVLVAVGLPIGVGLIVGPLSAIIATHAADTVVIPNTMDDAANNYLFVALPFFVFAGLILADAGVSLILARLIDRVLGRLRGGFYQVILGTMFLFSGLSGSKFADMTAVGTPLEKMVDSLGYDRAESAAVLAAGAVMGETIPPSIALIILGSITTISVSSLFIGGILPAIVLMAALSVYIFFRHRRRRRTSALGEESGPGAARLLILAIPGLLLPVLLIWGIVGGIGTPTEVSSFAVVYGVVIAALVYRTRAHAMVTSLRRTLATSGWILFLLAGASLFSWVLTFDNLPQDVANLATGLGSKWEFLLLSMAIVIIFGLILEGAAALIVLAPILLPAAQLLGINPVQYGLIMVIGMGIGTHLPPVGVGLYVSSAVMRTPVESTFRRMLWFVLILVIGLLLIALIPPLSLALPRALGLG